MTNTPQKFLSDPCPIRIPDKLSYEDLKNLMDVKCAAIHIKEFCPKDPALFFHYPF